MNPIPDHLLVRFRKAKREEYYAKIEERLLEVIKVIVLTIVLVILMIAKLVLILILIPCIAIRLIVKRVLAKARGK